MNVAQFLRSVNAFDLLVVLIMFAMFILGFIQGTIRRLLGIASILFSFLLAANLREPLGNFLAQNWTQFPPEYAIMVGFGTLFVASAVAFTLFIQTFYRKVSLFEKYTVLDELLGGTLGVVQGMLMLGAVLIILDSFFQIPGIRPVSTELPFLRELHNAYTSSGTAVLYRQTLVPGFLAVTGLFMPDALRAMFPRA